MSSDNEIALGKEVVSYCGKCKMPLGHVIVTLNKRGHVGRCQCMTCKAVHAYRDPDKPVKAPGTGKRGSKKDAVSAEVTWANAVSNAKGTAKPYKMSAEFSRGDLIEHPMFGKGVVEEVMTQTKIKVIFETSAKLLVQNRQSPA